MSDDQRILDIERRLSMIGKKDSIRYRHERAVLLHELTMLKGAPKLQRTTTEVGDRTPFQNPSKACHFWKGEPVKWQLIDGRFAIARVLDTVAPGEKGQIEVERIYPNRAAYLADNPVDTSEA